MEGKFEVTTIVNQWEPPFEKSKTLVEYIGSEGEDFDDTIGTNIFKIEKLSNDYAVVRFNHQFTLKKSQYIVEELLLEPQLIKLPKNVEMEFSYMWGNKGITKKIVYKGKA